MNSLSFWKRILPSAIRARFVNNPEIQKVSENIGWLFFDNILRIGVGLFVGVWIARYLGPEKFGLLNFALAFTGLFGAIATMGLQGIVVRDIVRDPDCTRLTLGTAALLQFIGGLVAYLMILGTINYLRPDDILARSIVAILGSMMLFKASDIAVYWFESQVQSKYTVWVQNSVFPIFAVIKVLLIFQEASLVAFVWVMLAEASLVALILLIVMGLRGRTLTSLHVSASRAKTLLRDSWPLILSAIAVTVYMKIDQIMLGQMIGDEAVGIYSAAVRISEILYFIPMAIVTSVFPSILEAKKRSEAEYYARLQKLYDALVWLSVLCALLITFLVTPLVIFLFGKAYAESGAILAIHVWAGVFVSLGVAASKWVVIENLQQNAMIRTLIAGLINIFLNYLLISKMGPAGAALSTLISYAFVNYLSLSIYKKTRKCFYQQSCALNLVRNVKRNYINFD